MQAKDNNQITEFASKYINNTNRHIFLTGKAGTGKTTFLKHIISHTHKNTIVAAPTGIAAINAGGVTLHSLFQLPFGSFVPDNTLQHSGSFTTKVSTPKSLLANLQMHKSKRSMLQEMELLIIDEVSMLRADLLDAIDTILRSVRRQRNIPFGGLQIMFIGDLLQLPPVVKDGEMNFLSPFYKSLYFFNALALRNSPPIFLELEKIYRQSDNQFINLLNNLRGNKITSNDIELLNTKYKPDFSTTAYKGYIYLTTHNRKADEINLNALRELRGKSYNFDATIEGDFSEYNFPVDFNLELKVGAQVMFIKNDYSGQQRYFNGKLAAIKELTYDSILVSFEDDTPDTYVEPYTWENKKYSLNKESNEIEEKLTGTFSHYPIKLAWAITVHKSQGLTFEKAVIDVSRAFAPGQIYVALSRLTSLDGLVLTEKIPTNNLGCDVEISQYISSGKNTEELEKDLHSATSQFVSDMTLKAFDFNWLIRALQYHVDSYDKDEKRSIKQQYKSWATTLYTNSKPLLEVANKFMAEINKIIYANTPDKIEHLFTRVGKAKTYFEPLLNEKIKIVTDLTNDLSSQKRIKKYINELEDLIRLFSRQTQNIYKAEALLKSAIDKTEFSKDSLKELPVFESKKTSENKTPKLKQGKSKVPKVATHEQSFNLYKEGKTIQEIAAHRDLVYGTIEGHMAQYVQSGDINILELVDEEIVNNISKFCEENKTKAYGSIKSHFGEEVSYGQIKLVVAHLNQDNE